MGSFHECKLKRKALKLMISSLRYICMMFHRADDEWDEISRMPASALGKVNHILFFVASSYLPFTWYPIYSLLFISIFN